MDAKLLSVTILKKLRDLKLIPDFADEVNEIIWRLEDLFFVKKKRHINPGMTEAGKYILDDNRPNYICLKIYTFLKPFCPFPVPFQYFNRILTPSW